MYAIRSYYAVALSAACSAVFLVVPAQQVALVFASEPAYAAWLSWYFLGETLDLQGWAGSGLILLAVIIGAFGSAAPETVPES